MGENLKSPLSSINPVSTHHSPGFLAQAQRKTVSEMNTLSPLIPLCLPAGAVREGVVPVEPRPGDSRVLPCHALFLWH